MYQKMIVVGNLGSDPDMRYMPDGTAVTSFSLATNRKWTDRQTSNLVEETTWFRVSVWGRQAETTNQYLKKGRRVLVEGVLTPDRQTGGPRTYTRQDGTVGASFDVRADTVRFLGGQEEGSHGGSSYSDESSSFDNGGSAKEEDEIPF